VGHGPARTLGQETQPDIELAPAHVERLDVALRRIDEVDEKFRAGREEERFAQSSKLWQAKCAEIDEHLRALAKVLIKSHQLNLDIGVDGGSVKARPWISEMSGVLDRLWFRLEDSQAIATWKDVQIASVAARDLSYAWVESAVVEWVVKVAEQAARPKAAPPPRPTGALPGPRR
jgi:hypothetical protein